MSVIYDEITNQANYRFAAADGHEAVEKPPKQYIQTLGLSESAPKPKIGFWRRQFKAEVTPRQRKFDWTFGVILPVICFFFDPIVFTSRWDEKAMLGKYMPFAYVLSYAAIMATIAWLLWGERLKGFSVVLSGVFAMSSLAAFAIGVVLFPFSLIGLVILIGALGFTPLFSSFVFLRNSVRTFRVANISIETERLIASFTLAASASAVIPYLINLWWFK